MTKDKLLTPNALAELCQYVCYQLTPSGSEELDRETLNFAIYWQISTLFNQKVQLTDNTDFKMKASRRRLENLIHNLVNEQFDALEIIDRKINEALKKGNDYSDVRCQTAA